MKIKEPLTVVSICLMAIIAAECGYMVVNDTQDSSSVWSNSSELSDLLDDLGTKGGQIFFAEDDYLWITAASGLTFELNGDMILMKNSAGETSRIIFIDNITNILVKRG